MRLSFSSSFHPRNFNGTHLVSDTKHGLSLGISPIGHFSTPGTAHFGALCQFTSASPSQARRLNCSLIKGFNSVDWSNEVSALLSSSYSLSCLPVVRHDIMDINLLIIEAIN